MSKTPISRIAVIQYQPGGRTYIASCPRRDINAGDSVEVLSQDGEYTPAEVVAIQHERWHCTRLKVVNLASEVEWDFSPSDVTFTRKVSARPSLRLVR